MRIETFDDPMIKLAAMQLETEQQNQDTDRVEKQQAREVKRQANEEAVRALHDKADAIRSGGWATCAFSVAGSGLQLGGIASCGRAAQYLAASGKGISVLAEPAGKILGDARAVKDDARSQAAKNRAETAQWAIDDYNDDSQKSERSVEGTFTSVGQILEIRHSTMTHILGKM